MANNQETAVTQSLGQPWNTFYNSFVDEIAANPNRNNVVLFGGLALSGKTTILGQMLYEAEEDKRLTSIGHRFYNMSLGQAWEHARNKGIMVSEKPTPQEFSESSQFIGNVLDFSVSVLPPPATVVFDAVLTTAIVENDDTITGSDRGTSAALKLVRNRVSKTVLVTAPEAQRREAQRKREKARTAKPEELPQVLKEIGIVDSNIESKDARDMYVKTATNVAKASADVALDLLLFDQAQKGVIPLPEFLIKEAIDFSKPENEVLKVAYLTEVYYPLWLARLYGDTSPQGVIFFNDASKYLGEQKEIFANNKAIKEVNLLDALRRDQGKEYLKNYQSDLNKLVLLGK